MVVPKINALKQINEKPSRLYYIDIDYHCKFCVYVCVYSFENENSYMKYKYTVF